jgi:hypothetical protein
MHDALREAEYIPYLQVSQNVKLTTCNFQNLFPYTENKCFFSQNCVIFLLFVQVIYIM